tara:strand:- start:9989 stop:12721 length:2733 start_codon:yes stop_codon:yes gene_type:complete
MKKTLVRLAIALPLLVGALLLILKLTGDEPAKGQTEPAAQKTEHVVPKRITKAKSASEANRPAPVEAMRDDDPIGDLRLEGQAVDEDGNGVSGAIVILGSAPPQTTTSEQDGSFAFENLVSRRYPVHARSPTLVGGPVMVTLSETSDPVLVRMTRGSAIVVEVVDADSQPIAGAEVTVPSLESIRETTDGEGIARIANVPPGQTILAAQAPGYAIGHSIAIVSSSPEAESQNRITLLRGTILAGTVVDHNGKPVVGAHIVARAAGSFFHLQDPKKDGVASDAKGKFQLTVPQGTLQLIAVHDEHPPATSERIPVDSSEVRDVVITMQEGANISGRVVTSAGTAVAWPTIRVLSKEVSGLGTHRQVIGDKDGTFEVSGLPKEQLLVHGASQEASSEATDVDMRTTASQKNITITLTVEGMIAGVVLDENGEPVPEAQVVASPDFWEGADVEKLRARGPAFATTAGDGTFTIRGLPDTKFSLRASKGDQGSGMGKGVAAKTGDSDVKVVLATSATIEGQVRMSDGSTPEIAMVSVGYRPGVPTTKGKFILRDIPPGTYELVIRGPEFATAYVPDIEVAAAARLDLGSVSVDKGRVLRGTVTGPSGQSIAGASVVMGNQVYSDGTSLTPSGAGAGIDEAMGLRRATTDDSGRFAIYGLGKTAAVLVGEHLEHGRSLGIALPKGSEDLEVPVKLLPVGSIRGTVKLNDQPLPNVQVVATATEGAGHLVLVQSDERGAFLIERVVAGEQKISAVFNSGGSGSMAAVVVTVEPDSEAEAHLAIDEGTITLEVTVEGREDGEQVAIDAAQVFLFKGDVKLNTGGELNALFLKAAAGAKMTFAMGAQKATFEKVVPGAYSVCVIPINGDMNDPAFAQKLQRNVDGIAVHCSTTKVSEAPEQQVYTAVVPPMQPLPDGE